MANENDDLNSGHNDDFEDGRSERRSSGSRGRDGSQGSGAAIALLMTGLLNLALALVCLVGLFFFFDAFVDSFEKQVAAEQDPVRKMRNAESIAKIRDGKEGVQFFYGAIAGFAAVCALVTIVGAICMKSLSAYWLAVLGCVATVIPTSGCCCGYLYSLPIGIWAFIVLFNPDVKRHF